MRSRRNSGVRLDYYQRLVCRTILDYQDPVTGLIPSHKQDDHAWVRDNVYSILSVWALSMAYRKNADLDEDRAKTYELEQACIKMMRGLLLAMMRQKDKVEKFKQTQNPADSLHAKYSSQTTATVVGDREWGHLQLDATSLYLLILAQMTASGLQIVFNLDEVNFIQNLVFYIEATYCIPDYGIWERGDKTNHGLPELNSSSIGMAKAALQALDDLDLFGGKGGPFSVIHVLADEAQKCNAVLQSMLPRESNSKEVDAALLSVIGYPAFAVEDPELIAQTRKSILQKLKGKYGCKRFLRDGYKTAKEDPSRLYYESWELQHFENIECEWPLFLCYLVIDACFRGERLEVEEYCDALEQVLLLTDDGLKLVPEMYAVSADKVEAEYKNPHSQPRVHVGMTPFMWAQSLFIIGRLLQEGFIVPGELDPLNRRLASEKRPDVVVQVVVLAEDHIIQEKLMHHEIFVQTIQDVPDFEVLPARVLGHIYTYLGRSSKLGLSGRQSRDVGILSTSKMYLFKDSLLVFTPQFADQHRFYLASDTDLLIDTFKTEVAYLKSAWRMLGRPTVILPVSQDLLHNGKIPGEVIATIKKLKSGYTTGTRILLGTLEEFVSTSCIASLSFVGNQEEGHPECIPAELREYLNKEFSRKDVRRDSIFLRRQSIIGPPKSPSAFGSRGKLGVKGLVKRSRSIHVENFFSCDQPSSTKSEELLPTLSEDSYGGVGDTGSPAYDTDEEELCEMVDQPSNATTLGLSQLQLDKVSEKELLDLLEESDSLEEHGDILHCLVLNKYTEGLWEFEEATGKHERSSKQYCTYPAACKGLKWDTELGDGNRVITVRHLLKELYEKAYKEHKWGLVRHVAGLLGKKVEDLAKAVTDLLVRQKQVTIGMPPMNEYTITRPQPAKQLRIIIYKAHGADKSAAMLTQELLVYLSMFIRTEPELFQEMLRLRVGLIIQVMVSELGRSLQCSADEASEYLLNMRPFEMKMLLRQILSGKEFVILNSSEGVFSVQSSKINKALQHTMRDSIVTSTKKQDETFDRQGQWIRRRRLDGALNRVPMGFYPRAWKLLERCVGLSIEGKVLSQHLTKEMTQGELKFALEFEHVLNCIPQPEYRQLMVEAIMVLTLLAEHNVVTFINKVISVDGLVQHAYKVFLEDQKLCNGDATLCCATDGVPKSHCNRVANLCQHFYDSAPSGCYGTMTYLIKAVAMTVDDLPNTNLDCTIS
ncbi:probable phosphorylase b kinase regulatory subunit alpha isoform X2 [Dermacentor andersoni]|uniref:probable phosphorylase b kinase regulatory subunit alpha isoform X2 n=1 Tax=Dermacentor andersoni TaxID=34620 RepID=UPI002154FE53|nr:probable phosphorylase b kinase regulatory subunit alpha isoform X2 [Dermacentor andersoni]